MEETNTILIGDIHGCNDEFRELLQKVSPGSGDRLILMGDILNKGPDPVGVMETLESLKFICLRGNHEADHLQWQAGGMSKPESVEVRNVMPAALYERYLEMALRMPLFYEDSGLIAVHGALISGIPLREQPENILTGCFNPDSSWKNNIALDRPLVVGHKRYSRDQNTPCVIEGKFYGIDTGCVYGGSLTALAMPSGRITQAPAARVYAEPGK